MKLIKLIPILVLSVSCIKNKEFQSKLEYINFDVENMSAKARKGLEHMDKGEVFYTGIPFNIIKDTLHNSVGFDNKLEALDMLDYQYAFRAFGNVPSQPNRIYGEAKNTALALGNSVGEKYGAAASIDNCLKCHASVIDGKVVAGLFNTHYESDTTMQIAKYYYDLYINPSVDLDLTFQENMIYKEYATQYALAYEGIFEQAKTRGAQLGLYVPYKAISRLDDPENNGWTYKDNSIKGPLYDVFHNKLVPVDANPWWLWKYKSTVYRVADPTHREARGFSTTQTQFNPLANEDRENYVNMFKNILAFVAETKAPKYEGFIDQELADKGADVFHARYSYTNAGTRREYKYEKVNCSECHGSYTWNDSNKEWDVLYRLGKEEKLRDVGTDLAYSNLHTQDFGIIQENVNKLAKYFEKQGRPDLAPAVQIPTEPGYAAPPLIGIWASAPYFHNGSVPSLAAVLNPELRPEIWKKATDPFAYNHEEMGLPYEEISSSEAARIMDAQKKAVKFLDEANLEARTVFDTRRHGFGKKGHTKAGELLNDFERKAVLEFLKTL